jgi:hypothetical protein
MSTYVDLFRPASTKKTGHPITIPFAGQQRHSQKTLGFVLPLPDGGSRLGVPFDAFDRLFEHHIVHGHEVAGLWESAALHIGSVFLESGDPLILEALVFLEEIPVSLRVTGNAFGVVSEDVVGKKELRVTAVAGA